MDVITLPQLRSIVESGVSPCVSIYLPLHPGSQEMRQDPLELKNLLRTAEGQLAGAGMRPTLAESFLKPLRDALNDSSFWTARRKGVAFFVSLGGFQALDLGIAPEPFVVVNDRFHVKPLLGMIQEKPFYVFAISQEAARLLQCTPSSCAREDLPKDVATSLDAAVAGEVHRDSTFRHSGNAFVTPSAGAGTYHGQVPDLGGAHHEDVVFYCRQLDEGARRVIKDASTPVVLAADKRIVPCYREASKMKSLFGQVVSGNPDHIEDSILHARAMELLEPYWHKQLNEEQELFGSALAQHKASRELREIVEAALDGRVATLFVDPGQMRWGRVDRESRRVEPHLAHHAGDEDLLDAAVVQTLLSSGRIVVVESSQVPGNGPAAAVLRY